MKFTRADAKALFDDFTVTLGANNGRYRQPRTKVRSNPIGQPSFALSAGTITITFINTNFPDEGSIENAGIRAGEIIAHRCWRLVEGDRLFSIYMSKREWFPNVPMIGNVSDGVGVHAFKNRYDLYAYAGEIGYEILIAGTVAMWGEIVEHERGYRAEYAKIISLETDDKELQMKYGVAK